MSRLADEDAREQIRGDLDHTLIVEAAAGTGKTTELVHRVMALLTRGTTTLARLVAVTFTEKAAGELKLRLRMEIEQARKRDGVEETRRLDRALAELEEAHIGTIHGFCADLLRQRPVEARVDPLFEAADEDQQERLFDEAFERWFQTTLADPPEGVRRVLRRKARDRNRSGPRDVLRSAGLALVGQRDFDAGWRRDPFDRNAAIDAVLHRLGELGALADRASYKDDWSAKSIAEIGRFMSELSRREAIRGRDYDGVEEELRSLVKGKAAKSWTWKGRGKWFTDGITREEVLAERQAAKDELDRVIERADADLAACLHEDLLPLVLAYEGLKERTGKLDFLDLLLLARNMVRDHRAVRNELQARFTHLLVDEFQDTDPLQAEILLLLAADDPTEQDFQSARPVPGKIFVVGDPKQSIYRFRRADVTLYEATKRRLLAEGAKLVHLTTSFRSAPSIQAAVNAAFAPLMQGSQDGSQAEYVALQPFRGEPDGQPTVVALPVPRPYSNWGKITNYSVDDSIPGAVGAFVDWLIRRSGWTVTERDRASESVPLEARHVCLLFRRFVNWGQDVTRDYVRALEARLIPHVLVGGRSFHKREEVLALRNALAAIEWPDDELSVFATLHGPFFALGDDALLAFRHRHGNLHPLKRIEGSLLDDSSRLVREALDILRHLHVRRNRRPTADTVAEFLEATRAHAGIANWRTGEQALANVLRVLDQARRFEASGATSFRAFVQKLEADAERGGAAEAPVVEEGTDGVRIMTVHKAKGLEFPVVILVDPTCASVQREPSRYVDGRRKLWVTPIAGCAPAELVENREEVLRHDAEEAVRLTYVAATRARDLLVVPVVGDERVAGWVDVFHPVLYPAERRKSIPAPGCPAFGEDSVLERPDGAAEDADHSVRPGLHVPQRGTHRVVWWDPRVLELEKEEEAGLRQQRILVADEGGMAAAGERAHENWRARRAAFLERGALPTLRVRTATEVAHDGAVGESAIALESTEKPRDRPHGARFGTLVHAILADVPLAASAPAVAEIARAKGQLVGASKEEVEAATTATIGALAHPLLKRAQAAGKQCRREAPVTVTLEDGVLVEGVVDLVFYERDGATSGWIVVDYKTDAEISGRRAEYEQQVRLYVKAVVSATGESAKGILLSV
jgi:ATP-dependent exoDNAse (exonuclease V) beta subunit